MKYKISVVRDVTSSFITDVIVEATSPEEARNAVIQAVVCDELLDDVEDRDMCFLTSDTEHNVGINPEAVSEEEAVDAYELKDGELKWV
jgi:hypothetical protein